MHIDGGSPVFVTWGSYLCVQRRWRARIFHFILSVSLSLDKHDDDPSLKLNSFSNYSTIYSRCCCIFYFISDIYIYLKLQYICGYPLSIYTLHRVCVCVCLWSYYLMYPKSHWLFVYMCGGGAAGALLVVNRSTWQSRSDDGRINRHLLKSCISFFLFISKRRI